MLVSQRSVAGIQTIVYIFKACCSTVTTTLLAQNFCECLFWLSSDKSKSRFNKSTGLAMEWTFVVVKPSIHSKDKEKFISFYFLKTSWNWCTDFFPKLHWFWWHLFYQEFCQQCVCTKISQNRILLKLVLVLSLAILLVLITLALMIIGLFLFVLFRPGSEL